jgi:hypothetical protein
MQSRRPCPSRARKYVCAMPASVSEHEVLRAVREPSEAPGGNTIPFQDNWSGVRCGLPKLISIPFHFYPGPLLDEARQDPTGESLGVPEYVT